MAKTVINISNSMRDTNEKILVSKQAEQALVLAKEAERTAMERKRLVRVPTLNGIVFTTNPERYVEYNKRFNKLGMGLCSQSNASKTK